MNTAAEILEAALELSREERIDLLEKITESIETAAVNELPGWDDNVRSRWLAEVRRRIDAFRRGELETVTHEELMVEIDEQLSK